MQQLTWGEVLRRATLKQLATRCSQTRRQWTIAGPGWNLGKLLNRQHMELAADGLDFADVTARGSEVEGFGETARWEMLTQDPGGLSASVDELELWDIQTARRVAVQQRE